MQIEILTKEEPQNFKTELIAEIKLAIRADEPTHKQWLRSSEVRKLLEISVGILQRLFINGLLKCEKLGGIFYYAHSDIEQLLGEIERS